jgi:hydroxymethylglutaryl-CoA lyase
MNAAAARSDGRPSHVRIVEMGPRDGLQNEHEHVPTNVKVELVDRLSAAGVGAVEVTSFVSPTAVPQLADAAEVFERAAKAPGVDYPVLVPNLRGYEAALAAGARTIAVFTAASESFNHRNINASIAESIDRFRPVVSAAKRDGVSVRGYVSCAFGCPFEGPIAPEAVLRVTDMLFELGVVEVSVGDTIGVATPDRMHPVLAPLADLAGAKSLALHLHDTRGTALANAWEALTLGISTFDASVSGLGGCPFAPGATGNVATEDLVWMLHTAGIATGVDLDQLVETSRWISHAMGRTPASHVAKARRWPWQPDDDLD